MKLSTQQALDLQSRADDLNAKLVSLKPEQILDQVINGMICGRVAVLSSFGAEAVVLLKLVADRDPTTPVVFLDTRRHFSATLEYVDEVMERLGLTTLVKVRPSKRYLNVEDPHDRLCQTDPDRCCHIRKTIPMIGALKHFDCIITGRKKFQTADRAKMNVVEPQNNWLRVNPLAEWTREDIANFTKAEALPTHPLVADGYLSIGCEPCTQISSGYRDGRWAEHQKVECGIHLTKDGRMVRKVDERQGLPERVNE